MNIKIKTGNNNNEWYIIGWSKNLYLAIDKNTWINVSERQHGLLDIIMVDNNLERVAKIKSQHFQLYVEINSGQKIGTNTWEHRIKKVIYLYGLMLSPYKRSF